MRNRYLYNCIECNQLIAGSNKPLNVPTTCSVCDKRFIKKQIKVSKSKLIFQCENPEAKVKRSRKYDTNTRTKS